MLDQMEEAGQAPDTTCFNHAIAGKSHRWAGRSARLCIRGRDESCCMQTMTMAWLVCVHVPATCKGGEWSEGVEMVRQLEGHPHLSADTRTCAIILQALAKVRAHPHTQRLLVTYGSLGDAVWLCRRASGVRRCSFWTWPELGRRQGRRRGDARSSRRRC